MTRSMVENGVKASDAIEIAFVNNMPDQALASTLAQFQRLLRAGAGDLDVRLRCYALPSISRSDMARRYLAQTHEDIESLYGRGADALIVTGTEPRAERLTQEPYWGDLARLIDWARDHTASAVWSCLAAHAVALRLDGLERRRAARKISGVYSFEATAEDWATRSAPSTILVPHSRYNGLALDDLERRGYKISSWSSQVGVDAYWRREPSLFVSLQGHPEYDGDTLMKEYRRDVLRFLSGERKDYPETPQGCCGADTTARLENLRDQATAKTASVCEAMLNEILSGEEFVARWADDAARLYGNWLTVVAGQRAGWLNSA